MGTLKAKAITYGLTLTVAWVHTMDHLVDTWFTTPQAQQLPLPLTTPPRLVLGSAWNEAVGYIKRVAVRRRSTSPLPGQPAYLPVTDTAPPYGTTPSVTGEHLPELKGEMALPQATDTRSTSRLSIEEMGQRLTEAYGILS